MRPGGREQHTGGAEQFLEQSFDLTTEWATATKVAAGHRLRDVLELGADDIGPVERNGDGHAASLSLRMPRTTRMPEACGMLIIHSRSLTVVSYQSEDRRS